MIHRFPIAGVANVLEQFVVSLPMRLEVETEIKDRLSQNAGSTQQKCDEETTETAVAVEERMDRFELHVSHRRPYQQRNAGMIRVQEALERIEAFHQPFRRRGHERRITRSCAADPVLGAPKFAGLLAAAAAGAQEYLVNLSDQTKRQWESVITDAA